MTPDEVAALYVALRPRLIAVASAHGARHCPEDVVHDAVLALLALENAVRPVVLNPQAWLVVRVRWLALKVAVREHRTVSLDERQSLDPEGLDGLRWEIPDSGPNPAEAAARTEASAGVVEALGPALVRQVEAVGEGRVTGRRAAKIITSAGRALVAAKAV